MRTNAAQGLRAASASLFLVILSGCAIAPKAKLDRARDYNADLKYRLDQSDRELSQARLEYEQLRRETELAQAHDEKAGDLRAVLEQRIDNLRQENDRLRADVVAAVMTTASDTAAAGRPIMNVSASAPNSAMPAPLAQALAKFAADHPGVAFIAGEKLCRFSVDALFTSGSDEIKPEGRTALAELAQILSSPAGRRWNLSIVGHTSKQSQVLTNLAAYHPTDWHLAAHQAIAVVQHLEENNVAAVRVGIASYGSHQPLVEGSDDVAHRTNARLEIYLLPPETAGHASLR